MRRQCVARLTGESRPSGRLRPASKEKMQVLRGGFYLREAAQAWHRTCVSEESGRGDVMNRNKTMLDLVCEVSRDARTAQEIVDRVASLVDTGRVRLNGNFRNVRFTRQESVPLKVGAVRRGR